MITNIFNRTRAYTLAIVLAGFAFASCEEDLLTNEGMEPFPAGPNVSFDLPFSSLNITEQDSIFEITVNLDKTYLVDIPVYISLGEESTLSSAEISFPTGSVVVPAGRTSATFEVEIHFDCDVEETETGTLIIGAGPEVNAKIEPATIDITLHNFVAEGLDVELTWAGSTPYYDPASGALVDPQDVADFDLYLYTELGVFVDAYGGASYEHWTNFGVTDYYGDPVPDGTYILAAEFYAMGVTLPEDVTLEFPLVSTFSRCGSFIGSEEDNRYVVSQNAEDILTSDDEEELVTLAYVTKTNGEWIVEDQEGSEVVRGIVLEGGKKLRK